ncbi:heat shock protein 90 [Gurleya vavrai]
MTQHKEEHTFDVEIQSLMSTIIHSMYSSKDFSIRELISNASDALTKYLAEYNSFMQDFPQLSLAQPGDLKIKVSLFENILTIEDNGIGMTKQDLINLLGKIASSGTKAWKQAMQDKSFESTGLIGQFGLGFYSSFLISDNVKVITKHASDVATVWQCSGFGSYTIDEYNGEDKEDFVHGTRIILEIRESDSKFKDVQKIEEIIKKYSNFIPHPIYILKEVEEEVEEENKEKIEEIKDEEEEKIKEINEEENKEDEPVIKEETLKKKIKVNKQFLINKEKPLWTKKPKDCTTEEYSAFYKTISNDWEDFLAVKHCTLEGMINLTMLLFIPKRSNHSMFEKQKKDNVKLFVQNVLVTDDLKDAVPDWLSFVVGVINSDDAPMNVSREMLQGTNTYKMIKNNLSKKVLECIEELSSDKEKYETFLKTFSANLKMAVRDNQGNQQERAAKLLRFHSSKSLEDKISFDDYIERNKENKAIYVLTGLSRDEVIKSPFLNLYRDNEVLFMYEPVDEIMLQGFNKYKELDIKRITTEGASEMGKTNEDVEKEFKEFTDAFKNELSDKIEKINLRDLGNSPCVVTSAAYSHSAAMENILRSQPGADSNPFIQMMGKSKKIFEINPNNEVIICLKKKFDKKDDQWKKYASLLFHTALIECGYKIDDGVVYAKKVFDFLKIQVQDNENVGENMEVDEVL